MCRCSALSAGHCAWPLWHRTWSQRRQGKPLLLPASRNHPHSARVFSGGILRSELGRPALSQAGAGRLASSRRLNIPRLDYVLPVAIGVAVSVALFFWLSDLGPALVIGCLFLTMYSIARNRVLLAAAGLARHRSRHSPSAMQPAIRTPFASAWRCGNLPGTTTSAAATSSPTRSGLFQPAAPPEPDSVWAIRKACPPPIPT